ncbi:MAG TPA: 50S ribosomal protein L10 [Pirellulales bacterium]|jgi:large subunit ribosomal protein L10
MSKFVKNLLMDDLKQRWNGVDALLLVSLTGLTANTNSALRKQLRDKNIQMVMVKNSLARRAAEGTSLAAGFQSLEGSLAAVWGGEDIVSLAKDIIRFSDDKLFAPLTPQGGVMDGEALTADQVRQVSKWPSRQEQLSILVGQILSPGANLVSQLTSVGGALASQIKQKGEGEEGADEAPAGDAPAGEAPAGEAPATEASAG